MFRVPVDTDQVVKTAKCDFSIESTYGCTGCTDPAFVIISASGIESTGLLPFKSNCSFFLKEVACSSTPQRTPIIGSPDSCDIRIKGHNQTLNFKMDYRFRGQVFSMGISTFSSSPTTSERLMMAFNSPNFFTSLQYSLGIGMLATFIIAIIKPMCSYGYYKMGRNEVSGV